MEVTGGRQSDTEQRRNATAAKTIVGRDEIERFGDASTTELLKRLPGVTLQGTAGRGGTVRMRGLSGGYTQILVDGEAMPAGFSLDSIPPEQIERIEILRAPTAETGTRAIGGTINIVTRDGTRKQLDELRLATQLEHGRWSPSLSWTRERALGGGWGYNLSLNPWRRLQDNESATTTVATDPATGQTILAQHTTSKGVELRRGMSASSRLQWRDGDGEALSVTPFLSHSQSDSTWLGRFALDVGRPQDDLYDRSVYDAVSRFSMAKLGALWQHRTGDGTRLETRGSAREMTWKGHGERREFDDAGSLSRAVDETSDRRDRNLALGLKALRLLGNDHSLTAGIEAETERHDELSTSVQNGVALLGDFGDNLRSTWLRQAAYLQDEWAWNAQWSVYAGLRWESLRADGVGENDARLRQRSEVLSPLLQTLWRPDAKSRDQVRAALTRSWRAPTVNNLVARPALNSRYPAPGPNTPTNADRAGNPALVPEIATGLDLAYEHYLANGGLVSIGVFQRRIEDLIRNVSTLETVSWAAVPRWVSRPQNVGPAVTRGLELEARFRLDDVVAGAPAIDLRSNASVFQSRVDSVPGPGNRIDQQPSATANFGADYRVPSLPLLLGGNLNWTPGYETRLAENQYAYQGRKAVVDAYALWTLRPGLQMRLSASNLLALDNQTSASLANETADTVAASYLNWQLRLEMKL